MLVADKPIGVDVLVVGGGIGGLMAAINAADHGAQVIIAEKANTRRSGSGATGNDHFVCFIPEVHGDDMKPIIEEYYGSLLGTFQDHNMVTTFLKTSFGRVRDWDRWGIPMKVDGKWEFAGHAFPGRPRIFLKYAGADQKKVLNKEVKRREVKILNRLSVSEVITKNGRVIGAVGISTEDIAPKLVVFKTSHIILATGSAGRLYPSITPGLLCNIENCPSCAGAGQGAAYRAGAKMVNMELPYTHAGPKYLARAGKATWIGVLKDLSGKPVGPFVTKPTKELGDITADVWNSVFKDMMKSGKGPVFMDCSQTAEEDLEYMMWGLRNEGNTAMLEYMEKEGIDVRKHMVEFTQYPPLIFGRGIETNEKAETSVKGLYAVGDIVGNFFAGIAGAAVYGWIAGKHAAEQSRKNTLNENPIESDTVRKCKIFCEEMLERNEGASWQEANQALQQIMNDYAGIDVRSETLLISGLKYLRDLKEKASEVMKADNSHELMRCLEVFDLLDLGQLVFLTALERKECRGKHKRADYPFTNPLLNRFINVALVDGKPLVTWRDKL